MDADRVIGTPASCNSCAFCRVSLLNVSSLFQAAESLCGFNGGHRSAIIGEGIENVRFADPRNTQARHRFPRALFRKKSDKIVGRKS